MISLETKVLPSGHFTSAADVADVNELAALARQLKQDPYRFQDAGRRLTLGLVFLNASFRTRLSTQKAARNLGMDVIVLNAGTDGWALEFEDGVVMNGNKAEHIRDAAAVIGRYCDIIGVRCFPSLTDREKDYNEEILHAFIRYSGVPVVSLESATRHPLQSLADLMTIQEQTGLARPKVVLTWAPHIRALPQAVPNSFSEWMLAAGYELVIAHPPGFDLHPSFTVGAEITHDQPSALRDADFVYVKNWSPYLDYGRSVAGEHMDWAMTPEKMSLTNRAGIMHCLPVRRNLELSDELLDGPDSLVLQQAENRVYAAQAVLKSVADHMKGGRS